MNIPKEKFYTESGVSSASVSQWKTGRYKPTAKKIKMAADYLGVPIEYFIEPDNLEPYVAKKEPAEKGGLSDIKQKAIAAVLNSSEEEAQMFWDLLKIVQKKNPAD